MANQFTEVRKQVVGAFKTSGDEEIVEALILDALSSTELESDELTKIMLSIFKLGKKAGRAHLKNQIAGLERNK